MIDLNEKNVNIIKFYSYNKRFKLINIVLPKSDISD